MKKKNPKKNPEIKPLPHTPEPTKRPEIETSPDESEPHLPPEIMPDKKHEIDPPEKQTKEN